MGNGDDDEVDSGWDADAAAQLRAEDDDAPSITIEEIESMPPSTAGPMSIGRRNTPRVMDAVVQARELDHTAAKQMALRKTPVRIPSAKKSSVPPGATSSVPPAPAGGKARSTAIRFADPPPAPRAPPTKFDRKATVKLSPATHKLAFDMAAAEDPPPPPDSDASTAEGLALDVTLSGLDDLAVSVAPPGSDDAFDDLPVDAVLDSHRSGVPPTNILATRKRLADLADAIEQRERGLDPPRPLGAAPASSFPQAPAAPAASSAPPGSGGELDLALDLPVSSEPVALDDADISSFPPPAPPPETRARGGISDLKMAAQVEVDADELIDAIAREESAPPPASPPPITPTLEPPPQGLAPEVEGRLEAARLRYDKGDFAGALLRIEPLAEEHPDCNEAVELLASCRDAVKRTYLEKLGSETSVPRVIMPAGEIQALAFDHRSGFLISLIDGNACVDEILDMSGMPPLEALRLLFELKQEGVIESAGEPRADGGRPRRPG